MFIRISKLLLVLTLPLGATTAYLRYGTAGDVATVTGAVTHLSTIRLTTTGRTFANTDLISVFGVEGCYEANGTRFKVKMESGDTGNLFHLNTLADGNVTGCATAFIRAKPGWVGLIQAYTLTDNPRVNLDGSAGTRTTGMAAKALTSFAPWAALKTWILSNIANCPGASCFYSDRSKIVTSDGANSGSIEGSYGTSALISAIGWKVWQQGSTELSATQAGLSLDAAKWWINNADIAYFQGSLATIEPGTNRTIQDYGSYYTAVLASAYSLIRDQLTAQEKTDFNDKMWNDVDRGGVTCVNRSTAGVGTAQVVIGNPEIVGVGTDWLTSLDVDSVITFTTDRFVFLVKTVTDDTHITVAAVHPTTGVPGPTVAYPAGSAFRTAKRWTTGDCGWNWMQKHKFDMPTAFLHGLSYGGQVTNSWHEGQNRSITMMLGRLSLALATADDDVRAVRALEEAWAWTFDGHFKMADEFYTSFSQSGSSYHWNRTGSYLTIIAASMMSSLASPAMDLKAEWMKRLGMNMLHTLNPLTGDSITWGAVNQYYWSGNRTRAIPITYWMYPSAPETQNAMYAVRTTLTDSHLQTVPAAMVWNSLAANGGNDAVMFFLYGTPSDTLLDYRSNPKQYLFRKTATAAGPTSHGFNMVLSRTGWTSTTDTLAMFEAQAQTLTDHQDTSSGTYRGNHGSYKIIKNGYLITEDSTVNTEDMYRSNYIDITSAPAITNIEVVSNVGKVTTDAAHNLYGGAPVKIIGATVDTDLNRTYAVSSLPGQVATTLNFWIPTVNVADNPTYTDATLQMLPANQSRYALLKGYPWLSYSLYQASQIIRWAGTDPTGDSSSRYTYALGEFKDAFNSGVATRVQRHFLHMKGGSQDYIILYDDIAATAHRLSTYIHYANKTGTVVQSDWSLVSTGTVNKIASKILNPGSAGAVRVFTGDSDDPAPGSVGTYLNGNGQTYRVGICASVDGTKCDPAATTAKWFTVHAPYGSTTGTFPTTTTLSTINSNFYGVQVADSSKPAVFVVSKDGTLRTAATFTTTYSGTGQVLIAGIAAGTYDVTGAISSPSHVVNADDNTIYLEGAAGAITVTLQGGTAELTITTSSVPGGTVGTVYGGVTFAATTVTGTGVWTVSAGALPAGLSLATNGALTGTPTAPGPFSFTVQVADDLPDTDTRLFSGVIIDAVQSAITITETVLPIGTRGVAYSEQLHATGGTSPYVWGLVLQGEDQTRCGLSLSSGGLLSGTITGPCDLSITVGDVTTGVGAAILATSVNGLMRISGGAKASGNARIGR